MTALLKRAFRLVESRIKKLGYRVSWAPSSVLGNSEAELSFDLEYVIAHLMLERPSIYFIQIGANDGISNDPLYNFIVRFGWEGILLEPLAEPFKTLRRTYSNYPKLLLLNAAISEQDGWRTLYTVRMDGVAFDKAHQFSSFRKDVLQRQSKWVADIADRIEERQVQCISFDTLLQHTNGRAVDLLQIDAEGFDLVILKMIDFSQMRPSIVCYEHVNLSKVQQDEAASLLLREGYRMTRDNLDTVAYRPLRNFGFR